MATIEKKTRETFKTTSTSIENTPLPNENSESGKSTLQSNRKKSFSERIGRSNAVSSLLTFPLDQSEEEKEEYKAFGVATSPSDSRPMFEIRLHEGDFKIIEYASLGCGSGQIRGNKGTLTFYTRMGRLVIKGKNFYNLKERFLAHTLYWIAVFDEDIHLTPQEGETIIDEITIYDNKNQENDDDE